MTQSLRALLTGVIDYAGMFPPASLSLEEAIHHYVRYRGEPENWLLGRFICPVGKLDELSRFVVDPFLPGAPLVVSALGTGGATGKQFAKAALEDGSKIELFRQRHGGCAEIDTLEVRLPADFLDKELPPAHPFQEHIKAAGVIEGVFHLDWYAELSLAADWRKMVAGVIRRMGKLAASGRSRGLKLRCGGQEAAAFPSAEQVALLIVACRDAGLPLKFTAGLHHPIRSFDAGLQVKMHGFINVFVAGVLAHARNLSEDQIHRLIEDDNFTSFRFDSHRLHWRDLSATVEEITAARRYVTSFGSCSFDEPRDDLRQLGWL